MSCMHLTDFFVNTPLRLRVRHAVSTTGVWEMAAGLHRSWPKQDVAARNMLLKAQYGDPHRLCTQSTKDYNKSCS